MQRSMVNQKGIALIIAMLIVLLVVGGVGAGYWYYTKSKEAAPVPQAGQQQQEQVASKEEKQIEEQKQPSVCDKACLENKFTRCETAVADIVVNDQLVYRDEIVGFDSATGLCKVKVSFTKNQNPDLMGKEMECLYDNKLPFGDAVKDMSRCSGPLYESLLEGATRENVACDNFDCLIAAAVKCQPLTATIYYSNIPFPFNAGMSMSGQTQYEIKKASDVNNCILIFSSQTTTLSMSESERKAALDGGMTDAQITTMMQTMNESLKSAAKKQTTCQSSIDTLLDYLTDVKNGYSQFESTGDPSEQIYTTSSGKLLTCTGVQAGGFADGVMAQQQLDQIGEYCLNVKDQFLSLERNIQNSQNTGMPSLQDLGPIVVLTNPKNIAKLPNGNLVSSETISISLKEIAQSDHMRELNLVKNIAKDIKACVAGVNMDLEFYYINLIPPRTGEEIFMIVEELGRRSEIETSAPNYLMRL